MKELEITTRDAYIKYINERESNTFLKLQQEVQMHIMSGQKRENLRKFH